MMPNKSDIEISVHPNTRCILEHSLYCQGHYPPTERVHGFRLVCDHEIDPYGIEGAKWIFPDGGRFVTYEPSDEVWARPLRFGSERPPRIKKGQIKLKRELPIYAFHDNTHPRNVRFPCFNPGKIPDFKVGYETFEDHEYVQACHAVERIDQMLVKFLTAEIGRGRR